MNQPNLEAENAPTGAEGATVKTTSEQDGNSDPILKELEEVKERYGASSSEAKRLAEDNKRLQEQLAEAKAKAEKFAEIELESELRETIPDYDSLDTRERELAVNNLRLRREKEAAEAKLRTRDKEDELRRQIEATLNKSEFKELQADQQAFREYAERHPDTSVDVLAKSFLFEKSKERGVSDKETAERASLQGPEKPGFGGMPAGIPSDIDEDQLEVLRLKDPKTFMRVQKQNVERERDRKINERILGTGR
jgi:hypothetical protein